MTLRKKHGIGSVWLVAGTAIGLVVLVTVNLLATVAEQEEYARDTVQREVDRAAEDLRERLLADDALAVLQTDGRFDVHDGAVVVPPEVGWLDVPGERHPRETLPLEVESRLGAARNQSPDVAEATFDELLSHAPLRPAGRSWVRVSGAWLAHRSGRSARRDALLADLDPDASPIASASALLLIRHAGLDTPKWASRILGLLDDARAAAVLARLGELGPSDLLLEARWQELRRRRQALRTARRIQDQLAAASTTVLRATGEGSFVVYQPEVARGAVVTRSELMQSVATWGVFEDLDWPEQQRLATPEWTAPEFVVADVVPGAVRVVGRPLREVGILSGPIGTALLVMALAVLCGGGSLLALRTMRREAEATRTRSEFLTTVTHELKTPLAGIRLMTDLLVEGRVTDPEKRQRYLTRLSGEAMRLSMLIENVLDLGRFERGEVVYEPRRENVADLLRDTLDLFRPLAERDGLRLVLHPAAADLVAEVDRDGFRQAVLNVLDNARKYAATGELIEVRAERSTRGVVVRVRDHGAGIEPAERDAIFERFRRGRAQQHGGTPGVGIGLNLARAILRRHGGELAIVDPGDGGRGACFEFVLPTADEVQEEIA